MGTIWVKEFTGGLDARRMAEATVGSALIIAKDGHITDGGEFEKRAAFVEEYVLDPGKTVSLAYDSSGIYVFGHQAAPTLPSGVSYQRLQHSDGTTALSEVISAELYGGKIYAVGLFADGSIFHFYDGTRVTDWFDGRARASFDVTGGSVTPAVAAVGSFEVTGGTNNVANQITDITIDGVSIINAAVTHTGNNATTAAAVASAINSYSSSPDYTATSDGQTVNISAVTTGTAVNGKAIVVAQTGDFTTGNFAVMAGGAATITSQLTDLKVDGVSVIGSAVSWATSNEATATAIASSINSYTSSPDYTATSTGTRVNIIAATAGAAANDRAISFTLANGLTVSPSSGLVLANGQDSSGTYQPGTFVKTVGRKIYSVSGPNLHFSGTKQPTKWTTDATGAGFVDMSGVAAGLEQLVAVAKYIQYIAIFSSKTTQIMYIDPDPTLNRPDVQTLENTGTNYPKSVTKFGENDLFYADNGVRSLRARDASNSASVNDTGLPVDKLIRAKLATLTDQEVRKVIGCIEPVSGRFWLAIKDEIFVFSYFPGSRVSAWSSYSPGFTIDDMVVFNRRVYLRSGDSIYVYGGLSTGLATDATVAEAWLPYLDANAPTRKKTWIGVDAAVQGSWRVYAGMQPTDTAAEELLTTIYETTFNRDKIPVNGASTHISLRFKSTGSGNAVLGSAVVHYMGDADED